MSEEQKYEIATKADMIVGGYAFFRKGEYITVVNLNKNKDSDNGFYEGK